MASSASGKETKSRDVIGYPSGQDNSLGQEPIYIKTGGK